MKTDVYLKLQKKFGGKWVATSKNAAKVYAQGKDIASLFANLKKKNLPPQKTVIGFMDRLNGKRFPALKAMWGE